MDLISTGVGRISTGRGGEYASNRAVLVASLSGILNRLVEANILPTEYKGPLPPSVQGSGIRIPNLPSDVVAVLHLGADGKKNYVVVTDSFTHEKHWYSQGALEAAGLGEKIGRLFYTKRWPESVQPPADLSGDGQIDAKGESIGVPPTMKGLKFTLYRTPEGVGYVKMSYEVTREAWFSAESIAFYD